MKPARTASARRPSAGDAVGRMSATCGRFTTGRGDGARASAGAEGGTAGAVAAASVYGRTTVVRASPVAGSISSGRVVPAGGSAENAGVASVARKTRRIALERDMDPGL